MNFITSLKSLLGISAQTNRTRQNDDDDNDNELNVANSNDNADVARVDEQKSKNSYPWNSIEELLNDGHAITTIGDSLSIVEHFKEFCVALGISYTVIVGLENDKHRVFSALKEWTKASRTMDDVVAVLVECRLEALAGKLNLSSQYQQRKSAVEKSVRQDAVDTAVILVVGAEFKANNCAPAIEKILDCAWKPNLRIVTVRHNDSVGKCVHFNTFPCLIVRHGRCDHAQDDVRLCQTFILFNDAMNDDFADSGVELAKMIYARFAGGVILNSKIEMTATAEVSVIRFNTVTSGGDACVACVQVLNTQSVHEWKIGQYARCDGWVKPNVSKQLTTNNTHKCDYWFQFLNFVKEHRFLIELSPHPHRGHNDIAWQSIVTAVTLAGAAMNQHIGNDPSTMAIVEIKFPRKGEFTVVGALAKSLKSPVEKNPKTNSTTFRFHNVRMGELRNIAVLQFTEQLFNDTNRRVQVGGATMPMFELKCEEKPDGKVHGEALSSVVNKHLELSTKNGVSKNETPSQLLLDNLFPMEVTSPDLSNAPYPDEWLNFTKQFLANLCTFGEPTPLSGDNYIRLTLYDSPDAYRNALRCLAPLGAMEPVIVEDILSKSNETLFIFGDAGSGKSSILRNEMLRDDSLSLLVRADLLWQCRSKLRLPDSRAIAIVDAHRQTIALTQVTEQFHKEWIDDSNRTKKLDNQLCKYVESGNCSLLIDALDEIPASERSNNEFRPWLEMLCKSWTNGTGDSSSKGLFRRVIVSSRYGVLDNIPDYTQYSCIAPMEEQEQRNYVEQLLKQWNCEKKFDFVWKARDSIGSIVSPLLLLMLCFMMKKDSIASSENATGKSPNIGISSLSRFNIYNRFLDLLLFRSVHEKKIEFPSWMLENKEQLRDDNREWIKDLLSLIGLCFHLVGAQSGKTAVAKFDVALLLEITHANSPLKPPPNMNKSNNDDDGDTVVDWRQELFKGYNKKAQRQAVVFDEGVLMWTLTLFGLVSSVSPNPHNSLNDEMLFSHRTFQEFLTAKALTSHPQRKRKVTKLSRSKATVRVLSPSIALISKFKWSDERVVANQWWDEAWTFVAEKKGVEFVFDKLFTATANVSIEKRLNDWQKSVIDNNGIDKNDIGHVRLILLLRSLSVSSIDSPTFVGCIENILAIICEKSAWSFETILMCVRIDPHVVLSRMSLKFWEKMQIPQQFNWLWKTAIDGACYGSNVQLMGERLRLCLKCNATVLYDVLKRSDILKSLSSYLRIILAKSESVRIAPYLSSLGIDVVWFQNVLFSQIDQTEAISSS